jgi:hypothetical protein
MDWTPAQRDELARENARIGIRKGERMPYPDDERLAEPTRFLALLKTIPDGAGVPGYLAALAQHGSGNSR